MQIRTSLIATAVSLVLGGSLAADTLVITTKSGTLGADAQVTGSNTSSTSNSNYGASTQMLVKNQGAYRKGYFRLDLSSLQGRTVTEASVELTYSTLSFASDETTITFRVYGLNNGSTGGPSGSWVRYGEDWPEGSISWVTAPANNNTEDSVSVGSGTANGGQAQLLGTFSRAKVDGGAPGLKTIALSGSALVNFLNADTNGIVTFILTRPAGRSGSNTGFASKESTTYDPPTLTVTVPSAGTVISVR